VNLIPTELNQRLANVVRNAVAADRFYIWGKAGFWRLVGLGLVAFGVGVGVGIGFYGYSHIVRNSNSMTVLSDALSKALSEARLRATAEGTIQIEPSELTLAKDQTIFLDSNSRIYLDPKAKIIVDGEINVQAPSVSIPQNVSRHSSPGVPTIVNFTVFKRVPFGKGAVFTGWKFLTSAQKFPTSEYCYYTEQLESSPLEPVVYIGTDEKLERPKKLPHDFDIDSAFIRCVWFKRDGE
jgi:hypothetical protein